MSQAPQNQSILISLLILSMAVWGLSWSNGKLLGGYEVAVAELMFWRFAIAALAMLVALKFIHEKIRVSKHGFLAVLAGGFIIAVYNWAYFQGTRLGPAGAGGVFVTTLNPIFTLLLVLLVAHRGPRKGESVGVFLGLIGGTLILKLWQFGWDELLMSGNLYFIVCASSWAFLTIISNAIQKEMTSPVFSFWVYALAAIFSFPFIPQGTLLHVWTLDGYFWLNLLSISLGAMAFATTIYFMAAMRLGSQRAAAFIFTVPVSAMLFSALLLGEEFDGFIIIGGVFSVTAVYLINQQKNSYSKNLEKS